MPFNRDSKGQPLSRGMSAAEILTKATKKGSFGEVNDDDIRKLASEQGFSRRDTKRMVKGFRNLGTSDIELNESGSEFNVFRKPNGEDGADESSRSTGNNKRFGAGDLVGLGNNVNRFAGLAQKVMNNKPAQTEKKTESTLIEGTPVAPGTTIDNRWNNPNTSVTDTKTGDKNRDRKPTTPVTPVKSANDRDADLLLGDQSQVGKTSPMIDNRWRDADLLLGDQSQVGKTSPMIDQNLLRSEFEKALTEASGATHGQYGLNKKRLKESVDRFMSIAGRPANANDPEQLNNLWNLGIEQGLNTEFGGVPYVRSTLLQRNIGDAELSKGIIEYLGGRALFGGLSKLNQLKQFAKASPYSNWFRMRGSKWDALQQHNQLIKVAATKVNTGVTPNLTNIKINPKPKVKMALPASSQKAQKLLTQKAGKSNNMLRKITTWGEEKNYDDLIGAMDDKMVNAPWMKRKGGVIKGGNGIKTPPFTFDMNKYFTNPANQGPASAGAANILDINGKPLDPNSTAARELNEWRTQDLTRFATNPLKISQPVYRGLGSNTKDRFGINNRFENSIAMAQTGDQEDRPTPEALAAMRGSAVPEFIGKTGVLAESYNRKSKIDSNGKGLSGDQLSNMGEAAWSIGAPIAAAALLRMKKEGLRQRQPIELGAMPEQDLPYKPEVVSATPNQRNMVVDAQASLGFSKAVNSENEKNKREWGYQNAAQKLGTRKENIETKNKERMYNDQQQTQEFNQLAYRNLQREFGNQQTMSAIADGTYKNVLKGIRESKFNKSADTNDYFTELIRSQSTNAELRTWAEAQMRSRIEGENAVKPKKKGGKLSAASLLKAKA